MGMTTEDMTVLRSMISAGTFPMRLVGYLDGDGKDWEKQLMSGRTVYGRDQLTIAGLKLYADGALGSRGALLSSQYSDDPGNKGIMIMRPGNVARQAERAIAAGMQVCVHAIGDSAIHLTLNAYEQAIRKSGSNDHRLRIEHCQVMRLEDAPRFAALGVIPSMQPVHCVSDMQWVEARLGPERTHWAYAWHTLIHAGCLVPGGTDFPIERPGPIEGIRAAVTRRDRAGKPSSQADIEAGFSTADSVLTDNPERYRDGWYGAERMTRREAINAFTIWAARAAKQEGMMGSLSVGKYADFVVVSDDLLKVPDADLSKVRVLETWIAGKLVWPAGETGD
jgi:predicted amidohydrolase YtcJ